ncbi:putative acylglycerol lipase [Helianthus annuus]|nr:putative acylglycerol lipase [Helianthus annuus]KAJ0872936.1 putative acylglycerol lipase [Helianthus annuus]
MEPPAIPVEELTSGASNRIIPVCRNLHRSFFSSASLRRALIFLQSIILSLVLHLRNCQQRHRRPSPPSSPSSSSSSKRKFLFRRREIEEDILRRRALAEDVPMLTSSVEDGDVSTFLFYGTGRNALFCRSWIPVSGEIRGILIIIHGLNEHSGRYADFARQLNSCNFGVYAMDWIGHGGSDGLHGYVPSLDLVVADTGSFLEKIKLDHPGTPCFLYGHSTGGAVVLKASTYPYIEELLEGIILTSPALRVSPSHPIVGAVAPLFSLLAPKYQFKGANKRGIPVSRDPAALVAKYSDPLVYTGPMRIRTGHEILRISSYLTRNFRSVTVPFLVLHGSADKVTNPLGSQDLYNEAASKYKHLKLYDGFLHDLLFEPEREEIAQDIIDWMVRKLSFHHS